MKKILLVEDDPFLRKAASTKLKRQGYAVTTAEDGELALAAVKQGPYDVVLLDLILPKVQGFEILRRIKEDPDPAIAQMPVIVLSNLGQESDIQKVLEMGATGYLIKANISLEAIVQTVEELLHEARAK
jgi:CheY-like chemotaxis protein